MKRLIMNRADIAKIQETLNKFPGIDPFVLEIEDASGIGYTIDLVIDHTVGNVKGEFRVPIVGVEDW